MHIHEIFRRLQLASLSAAATHKHLEDLYQGVELNSAEQVILSIHVEEVESKARVLIDRIRSIQTSLGRDLGIIPEGTGE